MYEVGMSANSRVEPVFEPKITQWDGEAPVSLGAEHLIYEEEPYRSSSGLLLKSGLLVLLAITAYGGYQFMTDKNAQLADGKPGYDWSGAPIDEKERLRLTGVQDQDKTVRKIDLTQTGSVKKHVNPIGKPVPIKADNVTGAKFHIVESGDTLSQIGRKFKISAAEIMKINSIEDARRIKPGMKLIVSK